MGRARTVGLMMYDVPGHNGRVLTALTATETAIHTIELPEGHFASIVLANASGQSMIAILDRDELEDHIRLLRNAMEDAERLDAGLPTIHAPGGQG